MRAVVVRTPGPLENHRVEDIPDPVHGPGEVLIESRAIGVNYPDLLVVEGRYQLIPPTPFVPGKEVAGLAGNRRVLAQVEYGAYAEKVVAREVDCHTIPDGIPFEHAAALGLGYQTAYFALLERAQYQTGESVLVTGASGGVGLAGVQLAKALGATVLAGVTSPEKGELCRRHGADHVIDLAAPNLRESVRAEVFSAIGKGGVDIVLDTVGGDAFDGALRALAWRGRLVVIGFAAGRIPELKVNYLLLKNIGVCGLQWSDYRSRNPAAVAEAQVRLFDLYEQKKLVPHVGGIYSLEGYADALARFRERTVVGKLLLRP